MTGKLTLAAAYKQIGDAKRAKGAKLVSFEVEATDGVEQPIETMGGDTVTAVPDSGHRTLKFTIEIKIP